MVGRHDQKNRIIRRFKREARRQRDRGGRVTALGFQDDARRLINLQQLLGNKKSMRLIADDHAVLGDARHAL